MNKRIASIIIVSFVGLAVFGFFGMGAHNMEHGVNGCIAALQRETSCPAIHNSLEFAVFHLSAYKIFSSANIGSGFSLSVMLIALMLSAVFLRIFEPVTLAVSEATDNSYVKYPLRHEFYTPKELKLIHWLALQEKRDPAFSI